MSTYHHKFLLRSHSLHSFMVNCHFGTSLAFSRCVQIAMKIKVFKLIRMGQCQQSKAHPCTIALCISQPRQAEGRKYGLSKAQNFINRGLAPGGQGDIRDIKRSWECRKSLIMNRRLVLPIMFAKVVTISIPFFTQSGMDL